MLFKIEQKKTGNFWIRICFTFLFIHFDGYDLTEYK